MNNALAMSASFEARKNSQATMITAGFAGFMLLLMFMLKWSLPALPPPVIDEGIEVNLGTSDQGFGKDQPMQPGEPSPQKEIAYTAPVQTKAEVKDSKDFDEDKNDKVSPVVYKPKVSKPDSKAINKETKQIVKTKHIVAVVTPKPLHPKAVLNRTMGGNGTGGNGADSYQKGTNEGIAGGKGDQGVVGGTPGAKNYTGPVKNFGVKVLQISNQSFEDDFNENAKVAMDIEVNESGKVVSADYQPKGSTTSRHDYIEKARRYAFQLKTMGNSVAGQKGTVIFTFKVKG
ncbi:MAG: hypothetical protein ACHQEB_05835 [Chitinophagales bacterium]